MRFRTLVSNITAVSLLLASIASPVQAAMVGTQQYLGAQDRAALLATIDSTLSRDDVRQELIALGVDPDSALQRANALSDEELQRMAAELESLPAGGDAALALIGAVFIVLIILELTGVINIFNKV